LERYNIHASETAWIGTHFDAVIDNNSSMDHLNRQINDLVQDLQPPRSDPGV
jgi:dephospho-CoA kinase